MELKYPNARLFLYDQLLRRSKNCVSALIESAYVTGILDDGSMDKWLEEYQEGLSGSEHVCAAKYAALRILEESLIQSGVDPVEAKELALKSSSELESDLKHYIEEKLASGCEQLKVQDDSLPRKEFCVDFAPYILDFLLQYRLKR